MVSSIKNMAPQSKNPWDIVWISDQPTNKHHLVPPTGLHPIHAGNRNRLDPAVVAKSWPNPGQAQLPFFLVWPGPMIDPLCCLVSMVRILDHDNSHPIQFIRHQVAIIDHKPPKVLLTRLVLNSAHFYSWSLVGHQRPGIHLDPSLILRGVSFHSDQLILEAEGACYARKIS